MCTARTKTITTGDGVRLHVRDFGDLDAPRTIVLMHGFCLDQRSWEPHAEELSRITGTRVITYDHRGHGKSGHADISTYSLPQLAADLSDVLECLSVHGEVTLAGHSMGGMTALEYLKSPASVPTTGLVLVATAAGRLSTRGVGRLLSLPVANALTRGVPFVPERVMASTTRAAFAPILTASVPRTVYTRGHLPEHARVAARAIAGTAYRTKTGFITALRDFDAYPVLSSVTAQTLVISGGRDALTPVGHARDMAETIPGAEHLHFPNAGHMVLHEEFHAVVNALELVGELR